MSKVYLSSGTLAAILIAAWVCPARAVEFDVSGYGDVRLVAAPSMTDWLAGGLGKFRYGGNSRAAQFEGLGQAVAKFGDAVSAVTVIRADEEQRGGVDALEAYVAWHPASDGAVNWSVKTGAFFPTISLENDDIGWTSPYTLTPSAINSWIGEELRTIGSEAILRWHSGNAGTFSLMGAVDCCNDPAGTVMADRGWAMDDRPSGLFERVRLPDATQQLFHLAFPATTGLFDEIDHRAGWYGGVSWQMADVGKFSVMRYENQGDPAAHTAADTAWETKFWSFGARTQIDHLVLIAQQLSGYTAVESRGVEIATKFQSAFLLASYDLGGLGFDGLDLEDWRASARADIFQTRHLSATPSALSEDGRAATLALSWQGKDWLRITGEALLMHSRRSEYTLVDVPSGQLGQSEFQLDTKFFF